MADFNLKDDLLGFGRSQLKYLLFHNTTLAGLTTYTHKKGLFYYDTTLDSVEFIKDNTTGWHSVISSISSNNPTYVADNDLEDRLIVGSKLYAEITGYNPGVAGFITIDADGYPLSQAKITFEDILSSDYTTVITAPGLDTRFATEKAIVDYVAGLTNYWKKVGTIISPLTSNDYLNVVVSSTDAIFGSSTSGVGVRGGSTSSQGIYGQSSSGVAGYFVSQTNAAVLANINPVSTNTEAYVINIIRNTQGTAANGIGGGLRFSIETTSGGQATECAGFSAVLSNATLATIQSDFVWNLRSITASVTEKMRLSGLGLLTVPSINLSSGTPLKYLYLDAGKNITYVDVPAGISPVDNILDWDTNTYKPYVAKTASAFYTGFTVPNAVATVLNYDGIFRATQLFEGNVRVMTTHGNWAANGSLHAVVTNTHAGFCPQLPVLTASSYFLRGDGVWASILGIGYWDRVGTTLSPITADDIIYLGTNSASPAAYFFNSVGTGLTAKSYDIAADFWTYPVSNNSMESITTLYRLVRAGGNGANGIGMSIDFKLMQANGVGSNKQAYLGVILDDATDGNTTSSMRFGLRNAGSAVTEVMRLKGNGELITINQKITGLAKYADNTAALGGGLTAGQLYRTSAGNVMVTY